MRSLPNRYLDLGDVNFAVHALPDFLRRCALKKQLQSLLKIIPSLLDAVSLACYIQFRT